MARPVMEQIFKALWRDEPLPTTYFEQSQRLQEGHDRIRKWKMSACHEGARQARAMMQVHFPNLDLKPIARVGPFDNGGEEIEPDGNIRVGDAMCSAIREGLQVEDHH